MRHLPDGEFKWILHIIDHWSKFNFAFPLQRKSASDVPNALQKWVFPLMGLPSILQWQWPWICSADWLSAFYMAWTSSASQWPSPSPIVSGTSWAGFLHDGENHHCKGCGHDIASYIRNYVYFHTFVVHNNYNITSHIII